MAAESARVWGRHEYTDPEGRLVTCRIQDVTPDLHDKLIHYYTTQFISDEAISKNLKMSEDEVSVVEYTNLLREAMAGGHCLVVLEDCAARPEPEVVAAGMYVVAARGDQSLLQGQGRSFRVIMAVFDALKKLPGCDPLERVPRYMTGMGMWVRRDRRRRGLAEAVVRAALASCRGRGIPHFSAVYTGIGSQRAATKAGLQEMGSVAYEGFLDENGKPAFDANMTEKFCKLLAIDIDIND